MKKFVSLLLAVSMMISLVACGNQKADKYCTSCGSGMDKSDSFCPECGTAVGGGVTSSSANDADEKTTATTTTTTIVKQDKPSITKPTTTTTKPTTTTAKPTTTTTTATAGSTTATTTTKPTTTTATTAKPTTTKTTTATTTSHKHTYSKYVCTGCGEIDKTHAYEYLIEWTKQNGRVEGTSVFYEYWSGNTRYSLTYSEQYKILYICTTEKKNNARVYSALYLNDYMYHVSWEDYEELELFGHISPSKFTSNSPITYDEYTGPASSRNDVIELARLSSCRLIEWLGWVMNREEIGINLSDLGFTSYQVP